MRTAQVFIQFVQHLCSFHFSTLHSPLFLSIMHPLGSLHSVWTLNGHKTPQDDIVQKIGEAFGIIRGLHDVKDLSMLTNEEIRAASVLLKKKNSDFKKSDVTELMDLLIKHQKIESTTRAVGFDIEAVTSDDPLIRKLMKKYQELKKI